MTITLEPHDCRNVFVFYYNKYEAFIFRLKNVRILSAFWTIFFSFREMDIFDRTVECINQGMIAPVEK